MTRRAAWKGARSLPWSRDAIARAIVAERGPMTHAEIGAFLGYERTTIQDIERVALKKLMRAVMREKILL